jgi:hypothetical protein
MRALCEDVVVGLCCGDGREGRGESRKETQRRQVVMTIKMHMIIMLTMPLALTAHHLQQSAKDWTDGSLAGSRLARGWTWMSTTRISARRIIHFLSRPLYRRRSMGSTSHSRCKVILYPALWLVPRACLSVVCA